jgi:MFS family permease
MTMLALTTCCLMTLAMGTLHAWSVFTADIEQTLGLSRASASLVYSLTLFSLTLTVLLAVPLFDRLKPWCLFALAAVMAGLGLLIASYGTFITLLLGYSLLFGVANGIGYGYALQLSARVFSHRSGFAMGITTASYALGATLGAQILGTLVATAGSANTLKLHGISFLFLAPLLSALLVKSKARYRVVPSNTVDGSANVQNSADIVETDTETKNHKPPPLTTHAADNLLINQNRLINFYRLSYGLAVFAGLMAMAHATPFINSFQSDSTDAASANLLNLALMGAIVLGIGNAIGAVVAGMASDTFKPICIVTVLPVIAGIALGIAAIAQTAAMALSALVLIGFTYGALIAAYPIAIARHFGPQASASAYGRIFISWGVAGLLAPVVAGALYDAMESYRLPLLLAMGLSILSAFAVRSPPNNQRL